jgi:hypothetical protein
MWVRNSLWWQSVPRQEGWGRLSDPLLLCHAISDMRISWPTKRLDRKSGRRLGRKLWGAAALQRSWVACGQ